MLHSLTEGSRSSLANLRAAAGEMLEYPDLDPELKRALPERGARRSTGHERPAR
ncbi:hypothetical protein [Zoogloea sp.]|uniref:hypothetical protein n=1 Tax=Zoogloea sp. TaxID=49181 RepID=UPI001D45266A|nr:hypothetical protein [Zoogloea sp.]MBK6654761.1 hypothetical protein [Zoogloea sp.]